MTTTSKCRVSDMGALQFGEGAARGPRAPPRKGEGARDTGNEEANLGTDITTVNLPHPRGARSADTFHRVAGGTPVGEAERATARAIPVGHQQGHGPIGEAAVGAARVGGDLLVHWKHVEARLQLVDRNADLTRDVPGPELP